MFFFLTSFTSILNLITSCFCSSRFHFTSFFHFLLCLIFYFLDLHFFEQQFPLCFKKKKNSSTYPFFHACITSVCPFAHRFVHLLSLFFSSFFLVFITFVSLFLLLSSLSITSLKDKFVEQLQKKLVCLFPFLLCTFQIYLSLHVCFFFDFSVLF